MITVNRSDSVLYKRFELNSEEKDAIESFIDEISKILTISVRKDSIKGFLAHKYFYSGNNYCDCCRY